MSNLALRFQHSRQRCVQEAFLVQTYDTSSLQAEPAQPTLEFGFETLFF